MLDILYNLYANQLHPLSYSQIMMNVLVLLVLTEVLAKMVKGRLAALVSQPIKDVHVKVSFFLSRGQVFFSVNLLSCLLLLCHTVSYLLGF